MNNPETVSESFIKYLEDQSIATFGTDLYANQVPDDAPDVCYWVITSGGSTIQTLGTGERVKQYFVSVYYRSNSGRDVEKKLFTLEELLNCSDCVELEGFEILNMQASQYPSDIDLDNEERRLGLLQATVQLYKSC